MVTGGRLEIDGNPTTAPRRWLTDGVASGQVVSLDEPLSFWGGFDSATGVIVDHLHPQAGVLLTDQVVVMRAGRGSSSASSVIAEAIRIGTAPAAIVMERADEIVVLGAIVADELYGKRMPIVVVGPQTFVECAGASRIALGPGEH